MNRHGRAREVTVHHSTPGHDAAERRRGGVVTGGAGDDAGAAVRYGLPGPAPGIDRRRVLALFLASAAAGGLVACGRGSDRPEEPDPLIALADAARADAALAAAAIAANPELTARVDPLRAARVEHAAALDAEVVRAGGTPGSAAPAAPPPSVDAASPAGVTQSVTLARVREAVAASQRGAAALVPDLPAERVGLVASVAACCATYAAVLA
jgi:hypothetical protein